MAMPEIWTPAPRKPGWPPTGMIPGILPPHDLLPPPLAAADGRAGSAENSVQNFANTFFERVTSGNYRHRTSLAVAAIHVGEEERCADRRQSGIGRYGGYLQDDPAPLGPRPRSQLSQAAPDQWKAILAALGAARQGIRGPDAFNPYTQEK